MPIPEKRDYQTAKQRISEEESPASLIESRTSGGLFCRSARRCPGAARMWGSAIALLKRLPARHAAPSGIATSYTMLVRRAR
jgi:hypothetical protein